IKMSPDDPLAIGREEWTAIITGRMGQPLLAAAIRVHNIDFTEVSRIGFEMLALSHGQFVRRKRRSERAEHDLLPVGRVGAFRVVSESISKASQITAIAMRRKNVHLLIVIPRVAALFARG